MWLVSHMCRPGATGRNSPSPAKLAAAPDPLRKRKRMIEHEALVAEHVHEERQIVAADEPRRRAAGAVGEPEAGIEGRREQRARAPFERVRLALARLDAGAAVARQHVEHLVIEMAGPVGLRAGRNLDELQRQEIAAALQVQKRRTTTAAEPPPGRGRHPVEIDRRGPRPREFAGLPPSPDRNRSDSESRPCRWSMVFASPSSKQKLAQSAETQYKWPRIRKRERGRFIPGTGRPIRLPGGNERRITPGRT